MKRWRLNHHDNGIGEIASNPWKSSSQEAPAHRQTPAEMLGLERARLRAQPTSVAPQGRRTEERECRDRAARIAVLGQVPFSNRLGFPPHDSPTHRG